MDRMVERAIPPDVEDPTQERIAVEAAENAIRQAVMVSVITGLFVFAALAALLYGFLPSWQIARGASQPSSEIASRVNADYAKLLQSKVESASELGRAAMERETLQGKVADLERRLEESAKPQPNAATPAAVSQDSAEGDRLQRRVGDLERQVTDLEQKLRATRGAAVPDPSAGRPKPARPGNTPASAELRTVYRCGDGRNVHNPASCKATAVASPEPQERVPSVPDTYYCGDGRTVTNPAVCGAAVQPAPRG